MTMQQYTTKPATVRAYRYDGPVSRPTSPDPLALTPYTYTLPEYPGVVWCRDQSGLSHLPCCGGDVLKPNCWLVDWKNDTGGEYWEAFTDRDFRERFVQIPLTSTGSLEQLSERLRAQGFPADLLGDPSSYNYAAAVTAEEKYTGRPHETLTEAASRMAKEIPSWHIDPAVPPQLGYSLAAQRRVVTDITHPSPEDLDDAPPE